jgi:hypothetical protein
MAEMTRHPPFASLAEMLAPEALTRIAGEPIHAVARTRLTSARSTSGSILVSVTTNDGAGPRFVVKRVWRWRNWVMQVTADERGREARIWTRGLLDRLPPEVAHAVLAVARDGDGWAILMRDVGETLFPEINHIDGAPLGEADHATVLDGLAALHAAFWDEPGADDEALGLCSPWHLHAVCSLTADRGETGRPFRTIPGMRKGWDALWPELDAAMATTVKRLLADPAPLCDALACFPSTLIHGDPRLANLGLAHASAPRLILLDWQFVSRGSPLVDLAWYLRYGYRYPVPPETTLAWYRERLERRLGGPLDDAAWQAQVELGLLGMLVRIGTAIGWDIARNPNPAVRAWTRENLAWWAGHAREGARRLGFE